MNRAPQEVVFLPSPECTLPTPDEVMTAVTDMHSRVLDAAPGVMPHDAMRTSGTVWTVKTGDTTLFINQSGAFDEPAAWEGLQEFSFEVRARIGQGEGMKSAFFRVGHDGETLTFSEDSRRYHDRAADEEQAAVAKSVIAACVAGEITPTRQEVGRSVYLRAKSDVTVIAREEVITNDNGLSQTHIKLEVESTGADRFSFKATKMVGGEIMGVVYRDERDYDGPFGLAIGEIACISDRGKGPFEFPDGEHNRRDMKRLPERATRDAVVNVTREVLTTGRLREVQRYVDTALDHLTDYRNATESIPY